MALELIVGTVEVKRIMLQNVEQVNVIDVDHVN